MASRIEDLALALSTRVGWTRTDVLSLPVPDLSRHIKTLAKWKSKPNG
ncbi:MAG: hypothetical protein K9H18_19490 [Rhodospirillum sp.]|nr:hypothetical protein [Rhodospirillum sp.]MCF8500179.1 hypothetical protein [Rhodospirillum sp.]